LSFITGTRALALNYIPACTLRHMNMTTISFGW